MKAPSLSPLMISLLGVLSFTAICAAYLAYGSTLPHTESEPAHQSQWRAPKLEAGPLLRLPPADAFVQTLARPLFWKSRRPYEAPPTDTLKNATKENPSIATATRAQAAINTDITLSGLYRADGRKKALLASRTSPEGKWLEAGDQIDNWTLSSIDDESVSLQSNDQTLKLPLYSYPR